MEEFKNLSLLEFENAMINYYLFDIDQKQELKFRYVDELITRVLAHGYLIPKEELKCRVNQCADKVVQESNFNFMFRLADYNEFIADNLGIINCIWLRKLYDFIFELSVSGKRTY